MIVGSRPMAVVLWQLIEHYLILQEMAQLRMELSKLKKQIRRMQNENNPGPVAAALAKTAKPLTSKN